MENGCWGVASGGIGHQRSFKVTTQGHLKKKRDSTKNFDKFVLRIIGNVTCLRPSKMGPGVSPVVEWVTKGQLRSIFKVM